MSSSEFTAAVLVFVGGAGGLRWIVIGASAGSSD